MDPQRPTSSRLIRQEKKKLVRQTVWFIGLAIILIVIFLFVVLPLFIRFINAVLNTNPIAEDETVLLQPPVISAPLAATNSASLKISGFDSPEHEVVLILNGEEATRVSAGEDGAFSTDITLTEGENSLTSYSIDPEENESKTGQSFTIMLDTEKPELTITEPTDGATISTKDHLVTVAGKTDPESRVFVNDRVVFPGTTGDFSTRLSVQDGANEIRVKAVDEAGNTTEQTLKITHNP